MGDKNRIMLKQYYNGLLWHAFDLRIKKRSIRSY